MIPGWKGWILLAVILLHVLAAAWLHEFRPPAAAARQRAAPKDETIMVLLFPEFRPKAGPAQGKPTRPSRAYAPSVGPGESDSSTAFAQGDVAPDQVGTAPLDLELRPAPSAPVPARSIFERQAALRYEGTRYERAWMSDGNLTQVAARRSKVAGFLLGAMGALNKLCTEADRRNYDPRCVQDQYEYVPELLMK